jgi:endonuclease/exonuclease/phosphatase family metal-dependent hydrolase
LAKGSDESKIWTSGRRPLIFREIGEWFLNAARKQMTRRIFCSSTAVVLSLFIFCCAAAETFCVATYNLENYLDQPTESRPRIKSAEAKAKIRESIRALKPDVLALQEMGGTNALLELRDSLKADGLDFPFWEHVSGFDTNIHVAVLSKFPFTARRPHTNEQFLLGGRRFRVSRGFAEVDINANTNYSFTLITAHLKSKRPIAVADEAEERLEEAKVLREIVDADLKANPKLNLVVLGDFNDTKNSASTKTLIGRGKFKLVDTRPAERNGDDARNLSPRMDPREITWTHFYGVEDTYSRIDYILLSPGMAREWVTNETYILTIPNWGVASDHRPLVATFKTRDE